MSEWEEDVLNSVGNPPVRCTIHGTQNTRCGQCVDAEVARLTSRLAALERVYAAEVNLEKARQNDYVGFSAAELELDDAMRSALSAPPEAGQQEVDNG